MFELGRRKLVRDLADRLIKTNEELLKQNKRFADAMLAQSETQLERIKMELRAEPHSTPAPPMNGFPRMDALGDASPPDHMEVAFGQSPDV